jgi:hypothetical protein
MRMRVSRSDRHWVRPCASQSVDGRWDVRLLRYSDCASHSLTAAGVSPAASVQAATWEAPVRPTACLGISDSNWRIRPESYLIGFA